MVVGILLAIAILVNLCVGEANYDRLCVLTLLGLPLWGLIAELNGSIDRITWVSGLPHWFVLVFLPYIVYRHIRRKQAQAEPGPGLSES